jgi:hypothetical protein
MLHAMGQLLIYITNVFAAPYPLTLTHFPLMHTRRVLLLPPPAFMNLPR